MHARVFIAAFLTSTVALADQVQTDDIDLDGYKLKDTSAYDMAITPYSGDIVMSDGFSGFGLLRFGGTSSSYPALKRVNNVLSVRLADDSAATSLYALSFSANGSYTAGILGNGFKVSSGPELIGTADGVWTMYNDAQTGFTRLNLGGVTGSFPALEIDGAKLLLTHGNSAGYATLGVGDVCAYEDDGDGLYWDKDYFNAGRMTGNSGAYETMVWGSPIWELDSTSDSAFFCSNLDGWTGDEDIVLDIRVVLNIGATNYEDINLTGNLRAYGDHDEIGTDDSQSTKSIRHDIGTKSSQYTVHKVVLVFDHDATGEVLSVGDKACFELTPKTLAQSGYVDEFGVISATVKYRTECLGEKVGTFPTAG